MGFFGSFGLGGFVWMDLDGAGWGDDYFGAWLVGCCSGGGGRGVSVVFGLVGEEREGRGMGEREEGG